MITLEAAFQGFFLIIVIHLVNSRGGRISSKAAGCMSGVLVEGGSFVGVPRVFHFIHFLLCERLFFLGGTALGACFIILSTIFFFNLPWKESFLGSTLRGLIFGKCLVLDQAFVKRQLCVGNIERFPS